MGAANGHTRRSDILHLPWRNDRRNCRPRFGARGIGADLGHVPRASVRASKVTATFDANRPRERSLAKQFRTETQLLDLVRAHVERFHRGPLLDGAQSIKIIQVANDPNRNWRIAYSGVAEDHAARSPFLVYPDERTSSEPVDMSQRCHSRRCAQVTEATSLPNATPTTVACAPSR